MFQEEAVVTQELVAFLVEEAMIQAWVVFLEEVAVNPALVVFQEEAVLEVYRVEVVILEVEVTCLE